jgi:hypothetical protein
MDANDTTGPEDESRRQANVNLVGSVWAAMDAGLDEGEVRDVIDQAVSTWEPAEGDLDGSPDDDEPQDVVLMH